MMMASAFPKGAPSASAGPVSPLGAPLPACMGMRPAPSAARAPSARGWACRASRRPQLAELSSDESAAVERLRQGGPLPTLAVLDLDHTVFQCYLDMDSYGPPYKSIDDSTVEDVRGRALTLYPEARAVCEALLQLGVRLAIASRSPVEPWYRKVLAELDMLEAFDPVYIHGGGQIGYPGTKLGHFRNITKATGIDFAEMVFFDDEYGNIEDMEAAGVASQYVRGRGTTMQDLEELLDKWRAQRGQ